MKLLLSSLLAFAAAFAGSRLVASSPGGARAARGATPLVEPAAPAPRPEVRALREKLAVYEAVPLRDLVLYGEEPLADRIRRAQALGPAECRRALVDWARRAIYDRERAKEMLAVVLAEEDPGILRQLADMIDLACVTTLTTDPTFTREEKTGMFPVVRGGEPPERRVAALRVAGGDRSEGQAEDVQALLAEVLRLEPEPAVVAAAAEEIEQRYSPDAFPALLDAYPRLEPGPEREKVASAYARWAPWPELRQRFDRASQEEHEAWARACARYMVMKEGFEEDLQPLYRRTQARDTRRALFAGLITYPPPVALLRQVADLEPDPDLRARYERVLAAADPEDPMALASIDVAAILGR